MKIADFAPHLGKYVRLWSFHDVGLYTWESIKDKPTWAGRFTERKGRNILVGGDWRWIPDVAKMEVREDDGRTPTN